MSVMRAWILLHKQNACNYNRNNKRLISYISAATTTAAHLVGHKIISGGKIILRHIIFIRVWGFFSLARVFISPRFLTYIFSYNSFLLLARYNFCIYSHIYFYLDIYYLGLRLLISFIYWGVCFIYSIHFFSIFYPSVDCGWEMAEYHSYIMPLEYYPSYELFIFFSSLLTFLYFFIDFFRPNNAAIDTAD